MSINWDSVIVLAAKIVRQYDTGVTLRQLFYRLVAAEILPNKRSAYQRLSSLTAQARRDGWFPALVDRTRSINRPTSFDSPLDAQNWLQSIYRRDRTEGQEYNIYLGVEKAGLVELLRSWFHPLGIPILALSGYASQTYVQNIINDVTRDGRTSVLLYAGDFDPSGIDIERDFKRRTGVFDETERVALTWEQVVEYKLPPLMGKRSDPRAAQFIREQGQLVQVEVDALPPDLLRKLYADLIRPYWNESAYKESMVREKIDDSILSDTSDFVEERQAEDGYEDEEEDDQYDPEEDENTYG